MQQGSYTRHLLWCYKDRAQSFHGSLNTTFNREVQLCGDSPTLCHYRQRSYGITRPRWHLSGPQQHLGAFTSKSDGANWLKVSLIFKKIFFGWIWPLFHGIQLFGSYYLVSSLQKTKVESHASSDTQPNQAALLLNTVPSNPEASGTNVWEETLCMRQGFPYRPNPVGVGILCCGFYVFYFCVFGRVWFSIRGSCLSLSLIENHT